MTPQILAIDIGFGNTKAVWNRHTDDQQKNAWSEICFRSVCPQVFMEEGYLGSSLENVDRVVVNVGTDNFYVGPKATMIDGVRALHPDFINTPVYEALLLGAVHYMFKAQNTVSSSIDLLVLGLPMCGYHANKTRLREFAARTHRVPVPMHLREKYGTHYVDVAPKEVLVVPQPMGGLRLAADSNVAYDLYEDGVVSMMMDPGYMTFDWFVTEALTPRLECCGSFEGGVSQILRVVSSKLSFDHGIGMQNFGIVEKALVNGVLNLGYKTINMEPYRAVANYAAAAIVDEFLQAFSPVKAKVSHFYVCGGGALFFAEALRKRLSGFAIQVMPEGVMSNCRGFWLAGNDRLS